jgi:hypothetical protein
LERSEVERYIAGRPPVELLMARSIVRRAVVVGPVMLAAFGLLRGLGGLVAAAIGVAIVTGYYLLTGSMMSWLARVSLGAYHAGALLGFIVRLGLIAATMMAVISLFEVDRTALGLAVIAAYVGLLLWEAAALGRNKGRRTRSRG